MYGYLCNVLILSPLFLFFTLYYQFCIALSVCSRTLAESSPYFEALKQKDVEVLFCYEPYDELVLMQLRQFDSRNLTSVEKEMRQDKEPDDLTDLGKYISSKCDKTQEAKTRFKIPLFYIL
jgi:HSP90 family molecular chaperone